MTTEGRRHSARLSLDRLSAQECIFGAIAQISQLQDFAPSSTNPYNSYFQSQPTPPATSRGSVQPCTPTPPHAASRTQSFPQDEILAAITQKKKGSRSRREPAKAYLKLRRQKRDLKAQQKPHTETSHKMLTRSRVGSSDVFRMLDAKGRPVLVSLSEGRRSCK